MNINGNENGIFPDASEGWLGEQTAPLITELNYLATQATGSNEW